MPGRKTILRKGKYAKRPRIRTRDSRYNNNRNVVGVGSGGNMSYGSWVLDCGDGVSMPATCAEADAGGWVDGLEVGDTGCVSHNIDCHLIA